MSQSIRRSLIIYYYNDDPEYYFYEHETTYRAWLPFVWPAIGIGLVVFVKKSYKLL